MDRIFSKSDIVSMCDEVKTIINQCKTHMQNMIEDAYAAKAAASLVPPEVSADIIHTTADDLIRTCEEIDFASFLTALDHCQTRTELIITEDSNFADEADSIKTQADSVKGVLQDMVGIFGGLSQSMSVRDFKLAVAAASAGWQRTLSGAEDVLDQIRDNAKGSEQFSAVFSKDPVNLSTGNLIADRTDLEIGGSSPFTFRRFYNAINKRSGSLGADWNHNYEVRILKEGQERVLVLEEGKEERFVKLSTGAYTSVYHSNGTLEETPDGYIYKTREQTCYSFDQDGYYQKQETLDGSITTLTYDMGMVNEKAEQKRLVKVARITGEAFTLTYDAMGYLYQVTDHTGRAITYEFKGQKLTGVRTPMGRWYRYHYAPNGKLESIENPREIRNLENEYDEHNRITGQTFPDGTTMAYRYDDENNAVTLRERNYSEVTYIHDDRYRDIKHIYHNGEERFEYNKFNLKTLVVDRAGNKTQLAYDEKGNLTRVINALGVKLELAYDQNNQPTYIGFNGERKVQNRYDDAGNLTETTDALGNTYRMDYAGKGRPSKIHNPDGSTLSITYDPRGNITALTDAAGHVSRYYYDDLNRVSKTIDGRGNQTSFTHDEEDNIRSVTNAAGDTRYYEYNESNKVTRIVDFDGSETIREYNKINRPSKIIDQLGRETLLNYDPMWNLARVTEPNGAKTTMIYGDDNLLERVRNANGDQIFYKYDSVGNQTQSIDEEGNTTHMAYDALGQLTKVIQPDGGEILYDYDPEGNVIKATDPLGNETHMTYDAAGNLIKEAGPTGELRSYTYTPLGMLEHATDEGGRTTTYHYQPGGQLTCITYPDATSETYDYNENGKVKTYTDRRGYTLAYTYDSLDQIIRIAGSGDGDTDTAYKEYRYDSMGNIISMTDGAGNKTAYEYTLTGQVSRVIDALGNQTEYAYDVCDRLIEIRQYDKEGSIISGEAGEGSAKAQAIDADLQRAKEQNQAGSSCVITRYERDLSGQITSITDALGQQETYQYNKKGELLEKVDKEGYLTKYGYTAGGDVAGIQYADGREVKLSYNPLRQLKQIEDWCGITKIKNDAKGRATNVVYPDGKEVSYTYGASGERKSITYPDGKVVSYGYDDQLRLSELKDGDSIISYDYNPIGDLIHKQFPNGMETTYAHNKKGQITSLIHRDKEGILDSYRYGYDQLGNKTTIQKQRRGLEAESGTYDYSYDPIGRLKEVKKDQTLQRVYNYDAFGNRISKQDYNQPGGTQTTTYAYNAMNQLIKKVDNQGESAYTYDKRGNLSQIVKNGQIKNEYLYGALNRLEQAINHKGETARYSYNGLGDRIGKQLGNVQGSSQPAGIPQLPSEGSLDPMNRLLEQSFVSTKQIDYTIDLTREYSNLLQTHETGTNQTQTYLWDDEDAVSFYAQAMNSTGEAASSIHPNYYLQDELGSTIRLADHNGALTESYGYDEFGQERYQPENRNIQPFGYTGYQRDDISKTYFAQAREYRAEDGIFGARDVVGGHQALPFTMHEYMYCFNNPVSLIDLDGEFPSWKDIKKGAQKLVDGAKKAGKALKKGVSKAVKTVTSHPWKQVIIGALAVTAAVVVTVATAGMASPMAAMVISGVATGAAANLTTRAVTDVVTGRDSTWKEYVADGVSGGVSAGLAAFNPAFAGPVEGALDGGISAGVLGILNGDSPDEIKRSMIAYGGIGAITGGVAQGVGGKLKSTNIAKYLRELNESGFKALRSATSGVEIKASTAEGVARIIRMKGAKAKQAVIRILTTYGVYKSPAALYRLIVRMALNEYGDEIEGCIEGN